MKSRALVRFDLPERYTPLVRGPSRKAGGLLPKHPKSHQAMAWVGSALGTAFGMALGEFHIPRLLPSLAFISAVGAFGQLLSRWSTVRRWMVARKLARLPSPLHVRDGQRGEWVRIEGVVQPCSGTISTVAGRAAVAVRYVGGREWHDERTRKHARWELHAVDFEIALPDGENVVVISDHLLLLPHPPSFPHKRLPERPLPNDGSDDAWLYSEETVVPGQSVVVAGVLDFVVDPRANGSDRQPRLRPVLRGEPGCPALVSTGKTAQVSPAQASSSAANGAAGLP